MQTKKKNFLIISIDYNTFMEWLNTSILLLYNVLMNAYEF